MTLGQFIKVFMVDAGLNQRELAEKPGMQTSCFCDIIKGRRSVTAKTAKKLEDIFGVPALIFMLMEDIKDVEGCI